MAGRDPAIHVLMNAPKDVDARVKPAHDDVSAFIPLAGVMPGHDAIDVLAHPRSRRGL
jgi:hypothetical protein